MDSLYAKYISERTDDKIIEMPVGFVTYRFLNEKQCYIIDIFVEQKMRNRGWAKILAENVVRDAKTHGRTELIGTVDVSKKMAKESIFAQLSYGMEIDSCSNNVIFFKKAI